MRDLNDWRLYGILDLGYVAAQDCAKVAEQMIAGGVDVIQLRGKEQPVKQLAELAAELHRITFNAGTPLIINDYPDVALRVAVEGVHVGQDDDSIENVRRNVGREIIVGKSTHSLEQARAAEREDANYIGFGPIFATPTKPDYQPIGLTDIGSAHDEAALPIFCIGGIKLENLPRVIAAGARRVVIVSGILKAANVAEYTAACKQVLVNIPL